MDVRLTPENLAYILDMGNEKVTQYFGRQTPRNQTTWKYVHWREIVNLIQK